MIKPIETKWKGYRFRSRLEARWAVFFEAMGWRWEYEPQGFQTRMGPYLPDFFLPDHECWLEIKPDAFDLQTIYLAGKIEKNCWRHKIAPDLRSRSCEIAFEGVPWYVLETIYPGLFMTGPFFAGCDHGCGHGRSTHGQGDNGCLHGFSGGASVFNNCLDAINHSDFVFAWIDQMDCYGTLFELGFAHAREIPIYIGVDERLGISQAEHNDLWFAMQSATKSGEFKTSQDAIEGLGILCDARTSLVKLEEIRKHTDAAGFCVFMGDPLQWRGLKGGNFNPYAIQDKDPVAWNKAANAARSARFEHGESPVV